MTNLFRRYRSSLMLLLVLGLTTATSLRAQEPLVDSIYLDDDSMQVFRTGGVTITETSRVRGEAITIDRVLLTTISRNDPVDISSIMHEIPAARVQTNSRGEVNLYLRNSGERQAPIFFDGALLNVPWDNRVDLSLVPANGLGGMAVSKGNVSVLYGANTMGGAVNIFTRELQQPGSQTELQGGIGSNGFFSGAAMHLGRSGKLNYIAAVNYDTKDAIALPEGADLPFSQDPNEGRTNTDRRNLGLYGRGVLNISERREIGLSLHHVTGEKGVAPESHLDPDVENVRYWRYPDWNMSTAALTYAFGTDREDGLGVRGSFWGSLFSQQIDQYGSASYQEITDVQNDEDMVLGMRSILSHVTDDFTLSLGTTNTIAMHDQIDGSVNDSGVMELAPEASYGNLTVSAGPEITSITGTRFNYSLGVSIDGMRTLKSADKPTQETFLQLGGNAGLSWLISPQHTLRIGAARKSRFATLREMYGEALRRFIPNNDLKPESALNMEIGYEWNGEASRFSAELFQQLVDNTIDQRTIDTLGGTRRMRINLDGSRVLGAELEGSWNATSWLRLRGHVTLMSTRAFVTSSTGADSLTFLSEKPNVLSTLDVGLLGPGTSRLDLEATYTGTSYSLNSENEFVRLPDALLLSARLSYSFRNSGFLDVLEVYLRGDNLTDAVQFYQNGLVLAGREIRGGVKVSFW